MTLKTFFQPGKAQGLNETYALHIDDEVLQVNIHAGSLQVWQGEAHNADVSLYTDMPTYLGLLTRKLNLDLAISNGLVRIEGDPEALNRFINICGVPGLS